MRKNFNNIQKIDVNSNFTLNNNIQINNKEISNENEENNNDNINVSFNEIDLYEIENSKEIKNKIFCYEFLNFIEILIHSILYLRKVYPQEAFQNFIIYNINLKFIIEKIINDYIYEFLESLEIMIMNNLIKRITINIIDPDKKIILEYFNLNLEINEHYNKLNYEDICLNFKSILYKFYLDYSNKEEVYPNSNKSFNLCIETVDSKVFSSSNFKNFKESNKVIEDNFIIEYFNSNTLKLFKNTEICVVLDHMNFNLVLSRNF